MRPKTGLTVLLLLACAGLLGRGFLTTAAAETSAEAAAERLWPMSALNTPEPPSETPSPTEAAAEYFILIPPLSTPEPPAGSPLPTETSGLPPAAGTLLPPEPWSGAPTYPESLPGYLFRVDYDPGIWRRGDETRGEPSLVHLWIEGCVITQAVGRGLPPGWSADNSFQTVGNLSYEVVRVSQDGVLQYVNYFGGDGNIFTGFQVSFTALAEDCLRDAESVLATLTSILAPTP